MGTHPIFESDFDCLTEINMVLPTEESFVYFCHACMTTVQITKRTECVLCNQIFVERVDVAELQESREPAPITAPPLDQNPQAIPSLLINAAGDVVQNQEASRPEPQVEYFKKTNKARSCFIRRFIRRSNM